MSTFTPTVKTVGDEVLTSSIIDKSVTEYLDSNITTVGNHALYNCTALTNVDFPSALTVGESAFDGCTALASVNLESATEIKQYAFRNASALAELNAPALVTLGQYGLQNTAITEVNFPALTTAGYWAFNKCTKLTTAKLPLLSEVQSNTFIDCWKLTKVDLGAATELGHNAFVDCYRLTTVILRSGTMCTLTSADNFEGCMHFFGTVNATYNPDGLKDGYIYVPAALVDTYKADSVWSTFADQIRAIEDYAYICDPYTWESVFANISHGTYASTYKIGDTIPLDLGTEGVVNMEIVAFDADDLADGSGKAPITWISKELLTTSHRMNPTLESTTDDSGATVYTEGTGTIGGWEKSEMRAYLKNTIKPLIPETVRNSILSVTKYSFCCDTAGTITELSTTDDIWIPSYREVLASDYSETNGVIYHEKFIDNASRIKKKVDVTSATIWWLRSANNKSSFYRTYTSGGITQTSSTSAQSIALGFCT